MATCRTALAVLVLCVLFILPVVFSLAISSISVPYDAPLGYDIATIETDGETVKLKHVDDASKVFRLSKEGKLSLKYPLQTLLHKGRTAVVVVVQHGHGFGGWEELINVHISGVNSKLHFTESSCVATVAENSPVGTPLKGLENLSVWRGDAQVLQVQLTGLGSEIFTTEVSSDDGQIRMFTNSILDREEIQSYDLRLFITGDGPNPETAEAEIHVDVGDQNDNPPEFFQLENVFSIALSSPVGTEAGSIHAVDRDSGDNGDVTYFLIMESPYFDVDSKTGVISVVAPIGEAGEFNLFLFAQDDGNPSLTSESAAQVKIIVKPLSPDFVPYGNDMLYPADQIMEFKQARSKRDVRIVSIDVEENSLLDTFIGTVTDNPQDTDEFSTNSTLFAVDQFTGNITLKMALNFEQESRYTFIVQIENVSDTESVEKVEVSVSVLDVSDPPFWTNTILPFIAVVPSDAPQNAPVYQLMADDEDGNALLRFYIRTGEGFYIDEETGEIKTEPGFVYSSDDAPYILSVYAEDINSVSEDDALRLVNGQVNIFVDSHPPQFTEDPYQVMVSEDVPTQDVLTVQAISFTNQRLEYSLLQAPPGTPDHVIDAETGAITLRERVDRELLDRYFLEVKAIEQRGDRLSSIVRIDVKVEDTNDNSPEFDQAAYSFDNIRETIEMDDVIGSVKAIDLDEGKNGMVSYDLSGDDASYFRVDADGNLFADEELDYDLRDETYFFFVMASDGASVPRSTRASVRVRVTPEDDEYPVFAPSSYTYYVDEIAGEDYSIGTVYASDADLHVITFSMETDAGGRFKVEMSTGVIKLTAVGDENLPDAEYDVVVAATDETGFKSTADVKIVVNDVNDNAPVFTDCSNYRPTVSEVLDEDATEDPVVLQVSATDADRGSNAELTYRLLWEGTGENPFVMDAETGVITLTFAPDREMNPSYQVTALARDKARDPSVGLCTFTILVEDVNDARPRFRRNQYEATIPVSHPVGQGVVTVEAVDPDLNSVITYSLDSSGIEYFRMVPTTGEVVVKQDLEPLADQTWTGTIRASDGIRQTTETLTIRIVDSTDAAPIFNDFDKVITIPENFSTNALENEIGEYSAYFPGSVADARITYSLLRGARPGTNFPAKFLLLNDESFTKATIIVSADLDFETVEEIDLTIVAEGVVGSFPTQESVKIILLDVNDNPPRFPLVDFDATVQEHSVVGTSVATVVAEDADSTPQFREMRYSIDQPTENVDWENFAIDPTTGEITTTVEFDRETTKTYLINVIAQNVEPLAGGTTLPNRAQTSVRIDILDINDNPPTFESESYTVSVFENKSIGFAVAQVTASDLDIDSTLRYFITNGNTNGVFEVDADSGEISIAVGLDFEKVQNYTLEYSANDGLHSAVTTIYMNVIDINDKRPEFDQIRYEADIEEESSDGIPGILLEVNAVDGDTAASVIEYSLDGTGANSIFSINRRTGVITINEVLDREEQASYVLIAIATDEDGQGLSGYATVLVNVTDINDNEPSFPQVEYAGSVPEGSPRGTEVMEVIAEDRDDPNTSNGRLMYAIVPDPNDPNDGSDEFTIDSDTGVVTTDVGPNELDAETQDTYTIKVTATDGTSTAETVATITIEDVNDNAPVFNPRSYSETIPETLPLGDTAVEVMATDADLKLTHEVSFVIVSGDTDDAFAVYTDTPTLRGLIYPQKVLDFESGQTSYTLEVDVSDGRFTDRATVSITVTDENEPPVFDPSTYSSTVLESIGPGNTIITVMARDPDGVSPNDQFSYSVDPTSDPEGLFTMIGNQLQVADGKELDRETVKVHMLTVLATDQGTPPLSGSATVEVALTDVDDTAPRFAENYVGYVEENTTRIQWVAVVGAVDDDITPPDPDFSFFIPDQPGKPFFAGTNNQGNDSFTIRTNGNVIINREENPSFDLVIEISDEGGNTGQNVLPIVVLDKNDNPHYPVTKSMLVYAFEGSVPMPGAVPNIGIGFVGVNDLDILEDKTYTVLSGESQYINIDEDTGLVEIAAGTPATDTGGPYTLDVLVSDGGKYDDVTSTIVITVKEVPREAVFKSGSLRLSGITPEEFITPKGGPSAMDKLLKLLSTITGAKEENIDIFTVLPVPDMENTVDVRYSAHGSPYYSAERLNGDTESNIALIESTLGVTVEAIYIDECGSAECEADCSNVLTIDPDPVVIHSVEASVVGINAFISPFCGCAAREGDVGTCIGHYCHNGGTCEDTFSGPKCKCEEGFTGTDCQGTTRSFGGNDYAILPTLEQCSETRTSVEFITRESSGLILYNGPTSKLGPQDYILLQLRAGKPLLRMDLGAGDLTLEVTNNGAALNDGKWHKVDIFRNGLDVELVIDDCASATVFENHTTSVFSNSESCKASATLPGDETVFHANKPLQLGGVKPGLEYPQTLGLDSVDGFDGCIRNVDQDSTLYDLYDVDEASAGSEPGCPDADKHCDALRPLCINGVCDADFSGAVCICNPGWFGDGCDQELDAYDFLDSSYVTYQLKTSLPLPDRESSYKIMIRTRQQSGRVWQITNANTFEHVTMQLQDGYLMASWHLGDNTISVTLDKYPLDNGEWHSIFFYRYDNYIQIKVDGGGGVRQAENRDSSFRILQVDRDNLVVGAELLYGVTVSSDFVGCMKDPRIGDNYLGVTETSEFASPMAVNVNEGCATEPCPGSSMCISPLVCFDIWRAFECRCPTGYTLLDDVCVDAQDCSSNPCQNGATCIDKFADYECVCPKDFTGKDCDLRREAVFLTIRAGGIIPIVACLLLLLLLLLLFIVYKRTEDKKNALAFAVDPEDDMRENFINYDEEGGEKDQTAYDITMLRKPVQPSPIVARPVKTLEDVPQRSIPRDGVNVGDFLEERLGDTDHDPSAPPYDTLHTYDYEGEGSTSGSLSSLNSNSSDGSQDYDYLKGLGPPFKRLADMYGGVE